MFVVIVNFKIEDNDGKSSTSLDGFCYQDCVAKGHLYALCKKQCSY